jgi:hypothetical protein
VSTRVDRRGPAVTAMLTTMATLIVVPVVRLLSSHEWGGCTAICSGNPTGLLVTIKSD